MWYYLVLGPWSRTNCVLSKHPSPCKRPLPTFDDPTVHMYMCYTYKWLLHVSTCPRFRHVDSKRLWTMGAYFGQYGTLAATQTGLADNHMQWWNIHQSAPFLEAVLMNQVRNSSVCTSRGTVHVCITRVILGAIRKYFRGRSQYQQAVVKRWYHKSPRVRLFPLQLAENTCQLHTEHYTFSWTCSGSTMYQSASTLQQLHP